MELTFYLKLSPFSYQITTGIRVSGAHQHLDSGHLSSMSQRQ